MFGVLNLNKPTGMTSRQLVNIVEKQCPKKCKVGHAGTLDPLATGVLVVAVGPATKLIQYAQQSQKIYLGSFRLGLRSDTEDITGEVERIPNAPEISSSELTSSFERFTGEIQQTPPQFSAVKVNGVRAYKAARKGETVDIKPRPAHIYSLRLVDFNFPDFQIEIKCGKGTYVRTLGRDIAKSLGSDSVMTALQRTAVGAFSIEQSQSLEATKSLPIKETISDALSIVNHLPKVQLSSDDITRLLHGKRLASQGWIADENATEFAALDESGQLLAILERKSTTEFGSKVNFVPQLYSQ